MEYTELKQNKMQLNCIILKQNKMQLKDLIIKFKKCIESIKILEITSIKRKCLFFITCFLFTRPLHQFRLVPVISSDQVLQTQIFFFVLLCLYFTQRQGSGVEEVIGVGIYQRGCLEFFHTDVWLPYADFPPLFVHWMGETTPDHRPVVWTAAPATRWRCPL